MIEDERIKEMYVLSSKFPWLLPGMEQAKGVGRVNGHELEGKTILGLLFRISFLPNLNAYDPQFEKTFMKIQGELKAARTQGQFDAMAKKFQEIQQKYAQTLCGLVKALLKGKNPKPKDATFRWLAAAITGSMGRSKLSNEMFAGALMQTVSSDSLGLNMVLVLLELCMPFLKVGDERLKRVDISYLYSKLRYDVSHETAICYSKASEHRVN